MSVNIKATAESMPKSIDSLETTPLVMHRIVVELPNAKTWYAIMADARSQFGQNWRGQNRILRQFSKRQRNDSVTAWFETPDTNFGTWVAVKHAVIVSHPIHK